MTTAWSTDALWVGPLIVERLKAQIPALRYVDMIDDLPLDAKEPPQLPAALVLMVGLRPAGEAQQRTALIEMDWMVQIVARSARRDADRTNEKLGPLIAATKAALQGWAPAGSQRGLAWTRAPRPDYRGTVTLFPLMFTHLVAA